MAGKGNRTRQYIIRQSLQLFCVKGYFNTSINDILAATGLTKGGFYGHFASKEALWYAVYDEAMRVWREVVFEGVPAAKDPLERIQIFIENDIKSSATRCSKAAVFSTACWWSSPGSRPP